jgi:hypothetical protein
VLINPIKNPLQRYFNNKIHFAGAMFGSSKEMILRIHDLFYARLDKYIQMGLFVGCDQQTIASIYSENSDLFHCILPDTILSTNLWNDSEDLKWFHLWFHYTKRMTPV